MSKYDQLEKLQSLKEKGALSDIEFEVEKSKILSTTNTQPQTIIHQTSSPNNSNQKLPNPAATTGLILGLVGIIILPLLLGIIGLVFSGIGLSKSSQEYEGNGNAIAGLILGVINLIWGVFWFQLFG